MTRQRLAQAVLLSYPPPTRAARGAEMLDTLLEATDDRRDLLLRETLSLITGGLAERVRSSVGASSAQTVADACKLASILYGLLWLTAFVEHSGWGSRHPNALVAPTAIGLLATVLARLLGRERVARVLGVACTIVLLASPVPISLLIVPISGFVIMVIAPTRKRPSAVAVVALAALFVASAIVTPENAGGANAFTFTVLVGISIAALLVFVIQPRLAIAVATIWTGIGIQVIGRGASLPLLLTLLIVVAAPTVVAATAVRALTIRRRLS